MAIKQPKCYIFCVRKITLGNWGFIDIFRHWPHFLQCLLNRRHLCRHPRQGNLNKTIFVVVKVEMSKYIFVRGKKKFGAFSELYLVSQQYLTGFPRLLDMYPRNHHRNQNPIIYLEHWRHFSVWSETVLLNVPTENPHALVIPKLF